MKPALIILFLTTKLFACANQIELASAIVNARAAQQRLSDLRQLVTDLESWDRFLLGSMSRVEENEFLRGVGQSRTLHFLNGLTLFDEEEVRYVLGIERKEQFKRWLLAHHAEKVYQGGFRLADYLGNFDVMVLFEPHSRQLRIASLRSLLEIQEFNFVLERELERAIGRGQPFRKIELSSIEDVVREENFRLELVSTTSEQLIRFAEDNSDKPAGKVLQRYRLLVTALSTRHLASVGKNIDTILAQKNIRLTPMQKHFQRFQL